MTSDPVYRDYRQGGDDGDGPFERRGTTVSSAIALEADPAQEIVPVESTGAPLSPAQRRFRESWLAAKP